MPRAGAVASRARLRDPSQCTRPTGGWPNYTWGHVIDDAPCRGGCKSGSTAGPFPVYSANRRLDRGNSDIDLRHRWAMMISYAPPIAAASKGVESALLKGWQ